LEIESLSIELLSLKLFSFHLPSSTFSLFSLQPDFQMEVPLAMKYDKILFCTDFSEDAGYALLTALDLAERYQARLYVLHVLPSAYQSMPGSADASGRVGEEALISPEVMEKGKARIEEIYKSKMGLLKSNYEFHVVWGVPFVEIARFARAQKVDFIVLGAAGSSNIKRITFGSTAENVARRAHCTVMITRDPEKGF
jgi:universal stress protein A